MCRHCVRTPFPDRDRMCLESGAFLANLSKCQKCSKNSLTSEPFANTNTSGAESDSDNSDTECLENDGELVSYNHVCSECRHLVSAHKVISPRSAGSLTIIYLGFSISSGWRRVVRSTG